jgi:hypothetical protein
MDNMDAMELHYKTMENSHSRSHFLMLSSKGWSPSVASSSFPVSPLLPRGLPKLSNLHIVTLPTVDELYSPEEISSIEDFMHNRWKEGRNGL